jgi:hypothetical protein
MAPVGAFSFAAKEIFVDFLHSCTHRCKLSTLFIVFMRMCMRFDKKGKTVGITLRIRTDVLEVYANIAHRANTIALESQEGGRGLHTAQDVMRHRLISLPEVAAKLQPVEGEIVSDKCNHHRKELL